MKPAITDRQWFHADHNALVDRYLNTIVDLVANHFQIDRRLLVDRADDHKNGSSEITRLRFLCFHFAAQFTGLPDIEISRWFQRSRTAIHWGRNQCNILAAVDSGYFTNLFTLERSLREIFRIDAAQNPLNALESLRLSRDRARPARASRRSAPKSPISNDQSSMINHQSAPQR